MTFSRSVIFFGDASQDTAAALKSFLLAINEGSLQSKFIHSVHKALQDECLKLSPLERSEFASVEDIHCLFRRCQGDNGIHPALQAAEIVTLQLGSFIAAYEQTHFEPYPDASKNIIVGVCLGELSAAAVSLAGSLTQLLPLAVESVRVAFRAALAADRVSRELQQAASPRRSWSIAISRDSGATDQDILDDIHTEIGLPNRNQTYISAYSPHRVTLSGPPTSLRQVIEKLSLKSTKVKPFELPINVPFHAKHLFSSDTITEILDVSATRKTYGDSNFEPGRCMLISGSDGSFCKPQNRLALLEEALEHILIRPVDWELLCRGCHKEVSRSQSLEWNLRPFGVTTSLENLVSYLNKNSTHNVTLDDGFWRRPCAQSKSSRAPLAIVGMAGRFPGATNHDRLWQLLMEGRDCHTKIPKDRFDPEKHLSQPAYGCFIESPGMFDPRFFNMSPNEALQTEPGQRLLLTTAYEALEMAGFVPNRTPSTQLGRIGTFYGQTVDEYKQENMPPDNGPYYIPGSLRAFGPGRVNRFFKFGGPASSIDTACSSSSVALNAACSAIWSGECDMTVAGGANILTSHDNYVGLSAGHFLSPTGGCKTFDDEADGYCRAEAVASVVIKRLDTAEADNDNILGVILAAATNYSADAISITHPHGLSQKSLYKQVLDQAGIEPFDVDYVEMHGTGTQAGDACEMESVTSIFAPASPRRPVESPLLLNAIKANIGHGEAASGITSLMKALLVLREGTLPPHIGLQGRLNRNFVNLADRNVSIPLKKTPLPTKAITGSKRHVLINNFGAAGGNTAMIIEEASARSKADPALRDDRPDHVVNITAKTAGSLRGNTQNMLEYLESNPKVSLSDLSYTTTARRIQHRHRLSLVCSTVPELKASLEAIIQTGGFRAPEKVSNIVFAFTGQGVFYTSLGKGLYKSYSSFRISIERLNKIATDHGFPSFLSIVDGTAEEVTSLRLVQIHLSILAVQISLVQWLSSLGVRPDIVVGHSFGEYGALCASGVLTPSDAIYLAGKRSELLEKKLQAGSHGMLAIKAPADTIFKKLCYRPEIACINGPSDTVLSGPVAAMSKACEKLRSCGFQCTILSIPYGFHSSQVDPILDEFETLATGVNFGKPQIPFVSPLLDDIVEDAGVIGPSYLRRQIRETVDFSGSIRRAKTRGLVDTNSIWIEIGPHPLCIGMVKSILGTEVKAVLTLRKQEDSLRSMAKAISTLSSLGVNNDWIHYHHDYESGQRLLVLPSYSFEEKNYWIERQGGRDKQANARESGPATTTVQKLVWQDFVGQNQLSILFESDMSDLDLHAAIVGHSVNGSGLCPASVYGDMALTIARYIRDNYDLRCSGSGMEITDMTISRPITVPRSRPNRPSLLRMSVSADLNSHIEVSFGHHDVEKDETEWSAKCTVAYGDAESWIYQWSKHSYLIEHRIKELEQGVSGGTTSKLLRGMVYRLFSSCVDYNLKYQAMQEVLLHSEGLEATALLNLYSGTEGGNYFCSPFIIDALIHLGGFVMNANDAVDTRNSIYISGGWKSMRLAQMIDPSMPYRVHVKMHRAGENSVAGDVAVLQGSRIVAFINDLKFQKVPHALLNIIIPPEASSKKSTIARSSVTRVQHPVAHEIVPVQTPERNMYIQTPYDGIGSQVFEVIAEQIGITTQEVYEIDDFAEMGVDSLLSLQIAAEIKEKFDLDFDSHIFLKHTTAQKLNRHLAVQIQADRPPAAESMLMSSDTEDYLDSSVGTPNSSVEDRLSLLHLIIAEQLGVPVHELFEVQDLSELGLDSLMSIQITTMLQERCGIKMKPDALTGVAMLASIEELTGIRASLPNVPRFESFAGARYVQQQRQQRQSVVLQGDSDQAERTVFLFPDGSGSPSIYSRLSFNSGQRVVALQSPFMHNPQDFELSIEAIAGLWIKEVRKYQRSGPYFLVGYSCGGYYALEAARQLLAEGAEIEHLLLIDSPSPLEYGAMPSSLPTWLSRQGLLGTKGSGNDNLTEHFAATIQAVGAYCPAPISTTAAPFPITVIWALDGAAPCLNANTEVLPKDVQMSGLTQWLLQRSNTTSLDADGWEKLLPGRQIDVRHTPGHHFSVLSLPNCRELSTLINEALSMTA